MSDLEQLPHVRRRRRPPHWTEPMLAVLIEDRFSHPDWLYERKLDGERCLVVKRGTEVGLLSRSRKSLDVHYPEIVDAVAGQATGDLVADGEVVVAFDGNRTSFSRLQRRMHTTDAGAARRTGVTVYLYLYLFDLLHVRGFDVTGVELRRRKSLLRRTFTYRDPLRYTSPWLRKGVEFWQHACDRGWEGVIAKRASGRYVHGRSTDWLKFKCVTEVEFVVGGYTDPSGSRVGLGALLVGYYDDHVLRYAGKVGTEYDDATLRQLTDWLSALEQPRTPYADDTVPRRGQVRRERPRSG